MAVEDQPSARKDSNLLSVLDRLDVSISSCLFRLSLPPILEALYSIPANFFGLVPSLAIFPLWLSILSLEDGISRSGKPIPRFQDQNPKLILLKIVAIILTVVFLVAWAFFQKGNLAAFSRVLAQRYFYMLAIVFNVLFLHHTVLQLPPDDPYGEFSEASFSIPIYVLSLWPPTLLIIIILKHKFRRERPIAMDLRTHPKGHLWVERKAFPIISYVLNRIQAKESFPSGDASSAAIIAIALTNIHPTYTYAAWSLLFVACTGRMYVLAHYFFDVLAGSLITYALYEVTTMLGFGIYDMKWWYPFASVMLLAGYMQTKMKDKYTSKIA